MTLAINELGYKPKMVGGAMVGLQATVFKQKLGPALNGIINYETWVPAQATPDSDAFLKIYQSRAAAEGATPRMRSRCEIGRISAPEWRRASP